MEPMHDVERPPKRLYRPETRLPSAEIWMVRPLKSAAGGGFALWDAVVRLL